MSTEQRGAQNYNSSLVMVSFRSLAYDLELRRAARIGARTAATENLQIGELLHAARTNRRRNIFRISRRKKSKSFDAISENEPHGRIVCCPAKRFSAQPRNRTAFLRAARAVCDVNALKSNLNMKSKFHFSSSNLERGASQEGRRPLTASSIDSSERGERADEKHQQHERRTHKHYYAKICSALPARTAEMKSGARKKLLNSKLAQTGRATEQRNAVSAESEAEIGGFRARPTR